MKFVRELSSALADYRVAAAVILLATTLAAIAVLNVTNSSGEQQPSDDESGKAARFAEPTTDLSKAQCKDVAACPPPAERSRFITEAGYFKIPEWDDRHLSEEVKAADPWRDPFWPAFVQCLQDAGVGIGLTTPDSATQADINRLVEEVNRDGPFYTATQTGLQYRSTPASDAFTRCEKILWEQRPAP